MKFSPLFSILISYLMLILFFGKFLGFFGTILDHFFLFMVAILMKRIAKKELLAILFILTISASTAIILGYDTLHSMVKSFSPSFPEWLFVVSMLLTPLNFFLSYLLSLLTNLLIIRILRLKRRIGGAIH